MTSGDEAGALTESELRTDSDGESRDVPAPAEPDPAEPDHDGADSAEAGGSASASASDEGDTDDSDHADAGSGADDDSGDAGPDADEESRGPASAGVWAISVAVLCALLIAGLVTAGIFWQRAGKADASSNGEQAAEAVARTAVTDLLTADYRNPGAWSAKLKPIAAGQFQSVVGNSSSGFKTILQQGKVQTTGKVVNLGVEKFGGTTAQLAVLAYETVKNTQTPKGSERAYRMKVSVIQSGSKWLVSNVEFVQ